MKFIFPQNYSFKPKIVGVIDYSTAILDTIWAIISFGIVNILPLNINFEIFLYVIIFFPVLLFSIIGFNEENIINVTGYILKYMTKPKVLLFKK